MGVTGGGFPEWSPCEEYGHLYESVHGWMVCADCGDEYEED